MDVPRPPARRPLAAALAAALAVVLALAAAAPPPSAAAGIEPTTHWDDDLDAVEEKLERGEKALRAADRLVERMVGEIAAFEASPRPLARAVALLALAEAADGRDEDARWHWHAAHALDRRAPPRDLERFGDAGAALAAAGLRRRGELPERLGGPERPAIARRAEALEAAIRPRFEPERYRRDRVPLPATVELAVDAEGRPHDPVLELPSDYPGFAYEVLEGARSWRFRPAEDAGGEPVPDVVPITIEFPRRR